MTNRTRLGLIPKHYTMNKIMKTNDTRADGRETISEAIHRRVRESSGTKVRFVIAIDGEIARSRAAEIEPEEFQEWLRSRACFVDV